MSVRVGVDVGGTFTDIVCFEEQSGTLRLSKVPSTPQEPHQAVIEGVTRALKEFDLTLSQVQFFIHGTTVATNTLLERKGAEVALLVTEGFRDVLYVMRQDRPRLYDYFEQRQQPLVPRRRRFEIPERVLFTGEVHVPMQEERVRTLLRRLHSEGVCDLAVCLLHSYANPNHERLLEKWIYEECPGARVSISSEILPEFKEFERMSTTVVNAYVKPGVGEYVSKLEAGLKDAGLSSGLHIMQSNGGIMTARTAEVHCAHTVLSGPAAGALNGLILGQLAGLRDLISMDVGGTSADVSVATEGRLNFAEEIEIGGQVVKVPSIEIHTVGAGGGSIAWIDTGGALQVGPESARALPGPACYGRGGTLPTVTDANLVLGRLNPDYFLGGRMAVDAELSRKAIEQQISGPLGLTVPEAAEGIIRVINAVMAKAIRRLSVEKGYDPREFTLVCFGGGGPLHAVELAQELDIPRVLIPPAPGVSSALGLLTADFRHDYVRTVLRPVADLERHWLRQVYQELGAAATRQMEEEGVRSNQTLLLPSLDMRYVGQGYSLPVHFELKDLESNARLDGVLKRFHEAHFGSYGYCDENEPTEIVNVRLAAVGQLLKPNLPRLPKPQPGLDHALKTSRHVRLNGVTVEAAVYERSRLGKGSVIKGPAIVEQPDSTTLLFTGQRAETDEFGNLLISLEGTQ
ncbi:MAG: hydantoinase/oxoprolinase family protein [Acidobacteriota bacterium]